MQVVVAAELAEQSKSNLKLDLSSEAEGSEAKGSETLLAAVVDGLSRVQKTLSPKYFYDAVGAKYFDEICDLDEYYPYRTEMGMLPDVARDIAPLLFGSWDVIEFGAGSLVKVRHLLDHIPQIQRFFPIDISGSHLREASAALRNEYQQVEVHPLVADITHAMALPEAGGSSRLGFFPGSTIGNFSPGQAVEFLREARQTLGGKSLLLIGVDTKKSPEILHNAYNDQLRVTEKFNRNILTHINREVGANFDEKQFDHYAYYNVAEGRVEMHLVSSKAQDVTIGDQLFSFKAGESIHTENSYKYLPDEFLALAGQSGWDCLRQWQANDNMFGIYLLESGSAGDPVAST